MQSPGLPGFVLITVRTPELEPCLTPRLGGWQARADQILRAHLLMEAKLLLHLGIQLVSQARARPQ